MSKWDSTRLEDFSNKPIFVLRAVDILYEKVKGWWLVVQIPVFPRQCVAMPSLSIQSHTHRRNLLSMNHIDEATRSSELVIGRVI